MVTKANRSTTAPLALKDVKKKRSRNATSFDRPTGFGDRRRNNNEVFFDQWLTLASESREPDPVPSSSIPWPLLNNGGHEYLRADDRLPVGVLLPARCEWNASTIDLWLFLFSTSALFGFLSLSFPPLFLSSSLFFFFPPEFTRNLILFRANDPLCILMGFAESFRENGPLFSLSARMSLEISFLDRITHFDLICKERLSVRYI